MKTQDIASKNKTGNYFNSKAPYFGFFLLKNFWHDISPCLFLRSLGVGKDGTNVDHGTEIGLKCTLKFVYYKYLTTCNVFIYNRGFKDR